MHPNYVGLVERGERNLTVVTLLIIAAALGVMPEELFRELPVADVAAARGELRRLRKLRGGLRE